MAEKELFITSIPLITINDNKAIPTVLFYSKDGQVYIGSSAIEKAKERRLLNEDFKIDLGNIEPTSNIMSRQQFKTAKGDLKSAASLTSDFINQVLKEVYAWLNIRDLQRVQRILLAEPLSMQEDVASPNWLSNYRQNLGRILYGKFNEIEFLPEPFAVFQYYRYGAKHPLLSEHIKHTAFVIDFGGGTFDTCIVETTKEGDISMGGKHARPLAASSRPIGGYFFNRMIAEELLFNYVVKQDRRSKAKTSLNLYKQWRDGRLEIEHLDIEHKSFITHFHELIYKVEVPKLTLCRSISNWHLDTILDASAPVALPENPFSPNCKYVDFNLSANHLRDIFIQRVWKTQLKHIIYKSLERGKQELSGEKISAVLLSGGFSNIRWLVKLIKRDFKDTLGDAEIIELQEDFQEVVAKGLAIECARRSYNSDTEFISVTYNPINLVLKADDFPRQLKHFKPLTDGIDKQEKECVLLSSASTIRNYFDKPIQWRVKLDHPPKHKLEYYFLRSTYSSDDKEHWLNPIDHIVYTPRGCKFDSAIHVEILVKEDGTCIPKFVYKTDRQNKDIHYVTGKPFYLDMTYNQETATGKAYIGLDFGTSNTSVSYVDHLSIQTYQKRAFDKSWKTLNELVYSLPYPLADPLARYMGEVNQNNFILLAREFIEASLSMAAYISYLEYCASERRLETITRLFYGFTQRSAGPLWKLLQDSLRQLGKKAIISAHYMDLLSQENYDIINRAVNLIAQYKHDKISERDIDHKKPVQILANISHNIFCKNVFGFFDSSQPQKFGKGFTSNFRHAIGNPPFSNLSQYKGNSSFSKDQALLVYLDNKIALPLQPLIFWDYCPEHPDLIDGHCYLFDKQEKEEGSFSFKAVGYRCSKIISVKDEEYKYLADLIINIKQKDPQLKLLDNIELNNLSR